jgi:hypothetical protein
MPGGDSGFRHVSALAACLWGFRSTVSSDTLRRRWRCARPHGIWQHWPGAGQHYTAARVVPSGYPSSSLRGPQRAPRASLPDQDESPP